MKDDILVEQTLAGDHQAFNSLITDHYADIYGVILSWVKNPEDAKDLTQDVFISAYLDLPSLRDHERLYSWLRQIARHKCQNWRRGQVNFVPLDNDLISKESSTDEVLILRETLAKVMEAIDKLPESEKILLKEHYLDGVSYDELKTRHRVSAGTLATRLFRVRLKIRNQLEKTLSAFVAFLHSHTESILIGGVEIMKLSIKTKLIAGGIAVMLASGGAGILIRQYYVQNTPEKALLHSTIAGTSIQATKQDTSDNINSLSLSKESNRKLSETIYFDNKQKNVNTSKNTKALEDDVELPRSNAEQDTEKHKLTILDFIPRKVFEYKAQKSLDELEIIVPQIVEHRRTINELDEYGFLKAPTQEERSEYLQQAREMRQELHEMELRAAELHSFLKDRDYDSIMPNWMREKADELDKPIISGEGWPPPKPQ